MYTLERAENDPARHMNLEDAEHAFYSFCSFVCLVNNKKMNIANIFIFILENKEYRDLYMRLSDSATKYDAVRSFLIIEPSLQKSKYIKRYINKQVEN